jgi:hypothetical protein
MNETLMRWHEFIETKDPQILEEILAEDVRFHSPFVWQPKDGKPVTLKILTTAASVFEDFRYVRQIVDEPNAVLEFEARVGELSLRGVDIVKIDERGKIVDFEVMVRPANALQALGMEMGKRLI